MKHGCPPQAIVATYGYDARTVYDWYSLGGEHCRQVHEAIVEQSQVDVQQVQADELCIRTVRLREDEIQGKLRIAQRKEQTVQLQAGEVPAVLQEEGKPVEFKEAEHASPDAMSAKEAPYVDGHGNGCQNTSVVGGSRGGSSQQRADLVFGAESAVIR